MKFLVVVTPPSIYQVHLPRLGPTITSTGAPPESAPPPCTAHILGVRPPFCLWSPAATWCTPQRGEAPWIPLPPLLWGTPTLRLPRFFPSSPWSVALTGGGTPPGPLASPPSSPISCCRTRAPTASSSYKFLPGTALLLPSFPTPLLPSPGFDIPPTNRCYCRKSFGLGMENPLMMVGSLHLSETRP